MDECQHRDQRADEPGAPMVCQDCGVQVTTMRDLTAELNNLRAANGALERHIVASGLKPNSTDTLYLQLEALKDLVVGDDPTSRLRFDVAYQRHAHAMLTKLTEGLAKAPALQVPGKVLHLPGK